MVKIILIIITLLLTNLSYGMELNQKLLNLENKYQLKNFQQNYRYKINEDSNNEESVSKINNGCQIEINYLKNKIPVLMNTIEKDFEFTVLHEMGHCVLGKDIFYQNIDWKIKISQNEKIKINELISQNEKFYLDNKKTPLIKAIYHEIFADSFASLCYLQKNSYGYTDIKFLMNKRYSNQIRNPYETHLSYKAMKYVLTLNQKDIKDLTIENLKDKSIEIAQKTLLEYIREEYE